MIKKNDVLKSKESRYYKDIKILFEQDGYYYYKPEGDTSVCCRTLQELKRDYVIPKGTVYPEEGQDVWLIDNHGLTFNLFYQHEYFKTSVDFLGWWPTRELAEQALAEIKEKIKNNI